MARVTVEDCIEKIPNRFRLVLMAAHRARNISAGSALTIDRDNDKNPVVALREIADETLDMDMLKDSRIVVTTAIFIWKRHVSLCIMCVISTPISHRCSSYCNMKHIRSST